jgi:hypothetical protein
VPQNIIEFQAQVASAMRPNQSSQAGSIEPTSHEHPSPIYIRGRTEPAITADALSLKVFPSREFTPLPDPGGCTNSDSVASRCDTGRAVYLHYVPCLASGSG